MPNTQSAKKALRQNARRRERNTTVKAGYKKALKEYRKLVAAKKIGDAQAYLKNVHAALDKAAKRNVIEKNKASRLKSRAAYLIAKSTRASS